MATYSKVFAHRLREERQRAGLSQAQLAQRMSEALGTGIDASAVSRIENPSSGRIIKLDEAAAAAGALGVPLSALLSEQDPVEARLEELQRELVVQGAKEKDAWFDVQEAQGAISELEEEIEQLKASRPD
ncbi:hypothetical protein GCM10027416_11490 [Okibacterium endophyticum]